MSVRRGFGPLLIVAMFALGAGSASAASLHTFTKSFGGGELSLSESSGVAVSNETGNVYVADTNHDRVAEYSAAGVPVAASFPSITSPLMIAVDNSSGPSAGDVYVASATEVFKFSPTGSLITGWGVNGMMTCPTEQFQNPEPPIMGIAVGADGTLYMQCQRNNVFIVKFDQGGTAVGEFESPYGALLNAMAVDQAGHIFIVRLNGSVGEVGSAGETVNDDVDPGPVTGLAVGGGTNPYVSHTDRVTQYGPTGGRLETFGTGHLTGGASIAIASGGTAYVADSATNEIDAFDSVLVPDGETKTPEAITRTSATFKGTINALSGAPATCTFQYTTEVEYKAHEFTGATSAPCAPAGPFSGSSTQNVEALVAGLEVGTAYEVRLLPQNSNGANEGAGNVEFATRSAVSVEPKKATSITRTTGTLNGMFNPEGIEPESCEFEYATEAQGLGAGSTVPCAESPATIGSGNAPVAVHADISGLQVATEYVFVLLGKNSFGTTESKELSFETLPAVNLETGEASELTPTTATLNGIVNPEGAAVTACFFEYISQAAFFSNRAESHDGFTGASTEPCTQSQAQIGEGTVQVPVSAAASGLTPNTIYHVRLAGASSLGATTAKKETTFETFGTPTIGEEFVSGLGSSSVTVSATIAPHGASTTFQVEYVSAQQFEEGGFAGATTVPVPPAQVGSVITPEQVFQQLGELTTETIYHYRFVATNVLGTPTAGPGGTFTTLTSAAPGLSDSRSYELVSPRRKLGEVIPGEAAVVPTSMLGGSCSRNHGELACLPGGHVLKAPMQSSPDGDSVAFLGQPFFTDLASGRDSYLASRGQSGWGVDALSDARFLPDIENGFKVFSEDLERGVLYMRRPALSPEVPTRGGDGFPELYLAEGGDFQPLVTETPPNRAPAGGSPDNEFRVHYASANSGTLSSPALGHVIFSANDALTPAEPGVAPSAPEVAADNRNLYEWSEGALQLVNVKPGNAEAASDAEFVSGDHPISADGSHVFWTAEGHLYVRIGGTQSKEITDPGSFLTAAIDGSKVVLSDGCIYDVAIGHCSVDLTNGHGKFQGVVGAAADLSRVYFVDTAVLAGTKNANGEHAEATMDNLYTWSGGGTRFIGKLLEHDNHSPAFVVEGRVGDWGSSTAFRTAQVTPDGNFLTFMSSAELTGYDNVPAGDPGKICSHSSALGTPKALSCNEVFEYDASTDTLVCPSCNSAGNRPLGDSNLNLIAVNGPTEGFARQPQNLPPDGQGRLFFESRDVLVSNDRNGPVQDLYQWEPDGVGSCAKPGGCLSLISSGEGSADEEPYFLDSSATGNDVFFITRQRLLLGVDGDEMLDLYDARVGGGFPEEVKPPCSGEACRGPASVAAGQASPGSATFSGPGNTKQKPKKHKKSRKKHKKKSGKAHKRVAKRNHGGSK